jgi:hypothetical protein
MELCNLVERSPYDIAVIQHLHNELNQNNMILIAVVMGKIGSNAFIYLLAKLF